MKLSHSGILISAFIYFFSTIPVLIKFFIYATFFRISYSEFMNPNELMNQEY